MNTAEYEVIYGDPRLMNSAWKRVWKLIMDNHDSYVLNKLLVAIKSDDPSLIRGSTTCPPPLMIFATNPVEGCCPVGYLGWQEGLETVSEVEEFFARTAMDIEAKTGEPAKIRDFLNFWDTVPPEITKPLLAYEIERELIYREMENSRKMSIVSEFLEKVYKLSDDGSLDDAGYKIFEFIDELLRDKYFLTVDDILKNVDVKKIDTRLMRSFLSVTFPAKQFLPSREVLYFQVEREMTNQ